jgi:S1-C subfamily serine protease
MNWMFLALVGTAQADEGPGSFTALRCDTDGPALPEESERALNSAVRLETDEGTGSGFFISPDGLLLTAAHVVAGEDEVTVVSQDGTSSTGTVLRVDSTTDLALVRVDATGRDCLRLAEARASVGSDVFVIGSPGGEALSHSMTRGIVSGYREVEGVVVLQTDASINAGVSGGPVVSATGEALGVVSYKLVGEGMEGLAFAVASGHASPKTAPARSPAEERTPSPTCGSWRLTPDASSASAGTRATSRSTRRASRRRTSRWKPPAP